jgi:hypothetical protein
MAAQWKPFSRRHPAWAAAGWFTTTTIVVVVVELLQADDAVLLLLVPGRRWRIIICFRPLLVLFVFVLF